MRDKKYIVGNWKMNQSLEEIKKFFQELQHLKTEDNFHAWVAPQAVHIPIVQNLAFTLGTVLVGSQNCNENDSGAFTGEISPLTLKEMGVHFTLVGHSERRAIYKESDELLNAKTIKALGHDLAVIFCVGETLEEREAGQTNSVVERQLREGLKNLPKEKLQNLIIAYEPVWAIGTGKTATPLQAEEVHAFIRTYAKESLGFDADNLPILYGGSVNPSNVGELLSKENIDGGLIGGASLKGDSFVEMCRVASIIP